MSLVIFDYISKMKDYYGVKVLITLMPLLLIFIFGYSFNKNIMVNTTERVLSDRFIKVIKNENPQRLYNVYDIGGELIYNDIEVFIDGRADLYTKYNYVDNYSLSYLYEDYVSIMEKYDFDYYLVYMGNPIYFYLQDNPDDFEHIYSEGDYSFYKKKEVK